MTRAEAVRAIADVWFLHDEEGCLDREEAEKSQARLVEVLHALGITSEEFLEAKRLATEAP